MAPTLEDLPESDRKRFAACWLHSAQETNWDAAFALFDPRGKTKLESFKTVTKRAAGKFGHNKRKKCDAAADDDAAPNKKKRATRAPRGKKAPTSEEIVSDDRDDTPVKEEVEVEAKAEAEAEAEPEEEEK